MQPAELLQWNYLIFLLPFGISALLLLLSSLRLGHHGGHGHSGAHTVAHAHGHGLGGHPSHAASASPTSHAANHPAPAHPSATTHNATHTTQTESHHASVPALMTGLIGIGRAPLPMLVEAFGIAWGFCGFCANQIALHGAKPSPGQILLPLGIALVGGIVGTRFAAEIIARLMPPEESLVVSQDALFGLTGNIAFPVSQTGGRIHIYDEFGSLHDETCRVPPGCPPIEKGRRALVVDKNAQGYLIVEEVPAQVR